MILLLADAPFGPNVKVSNWDITTGLDQLEVSMAKSPSWIAAHWIDLDWTGWFSANDEVLGDPSVASELSDPNKFYAVGMVYCNPYNKPGQRIQLVLLNITTK